ncbi:RmlC-like cupin domain-containing protein [Paraphoma chrysanthemicola]|uniref:RmlC-like cupin domain-containing protein n=1 Tax=Paraphoma chrysanthemicola TaxID=798071 RepID=A0A8K0R290_9PLEO|nr:RmlC-like cupin domain-containing protein [Paraphoma chrysanthemicola]
MDRMVPPHPNPKAVTTSWDYSLMRPALIEASEIVSAEEAERRVLILVNQSMSAPNTTDTIYAGLQVVLPGETAPAHRHRAFALRFIIEGSEGYTAVEGAKIKMSKGDVILTPSWHWHDHGNEGSDPVIWLDALDLPLWQFLPINILQQFEEPRYPNGSGLSQTISAQAERIIPGHTTDLNQDVFSYVYHVYQGHGFSMVKSPNDTIAKKIEWGPRDTFAVPAWSEVSHTCSLNGGFAYLFAVNDIPMIKALTFIKPKS